MCQGNLNGVPGLTPRVGAGALALALLATKDPTTTVAFASNEKRHEIARQAAARYGHRYLGMGVGMGVDSPDTFYRDPSTWTIAPIPLSNRQRLDDVARMMHDLPAGGTDCAQPMLYAAREQLEIDTFVIITDNETWEGDVHPVQALRAYREQSGINAKVVVIAMTSGGFSIADPADPGMLDVVGFDTTVPQIIHEFMGAPRGDIQTTD